MTGWQRLSRLLPAAHELIYDGDIGQIILAVHCMGNAHVAQGVVAIFRRIVRVIRQGWPASVIELADSGLAVPMLCTQGITRPIGLIPMPAWRR